MNLHLQNIIPSKKLFFILFLFYLIISFSRTRDHRRTKSPSRHRSHINDDRVAPSSKTEQQSQSESVPSSSPMTVPSTQQHKTLASIIEPAIEKTPSVPLLSNLSNNIQSVETNSLNQSNDTTDDKNSNGEKKRKKHHHHHHKKHRRHRSKSKKRHHSKDKESETIIDNTISITEAQ